ncbi:MAG: GNAT family N-acetyltransferase [Eubacteriaceae bacterium]|nr:GNAT family N-acetyltransferase [Eubacteriaceae bacterium]
MKNISVVKYSESDIPRMVEIWNEVIEDGIAFPQEEFLTIEEAKEFFAAQDYTAVAKDEEGTVYGLYILHPNNVGRCGHLANTSYAVDSRLRGNGAGRKLVMDSLRMGKECGFRILQFNAVVKTNLPARKIYESLGFNHIGTIPGGFRMKDGHFEDICLYYYEL